MQAIGENTVLAQRYTLTRKLAGQRDQELWIATDATLDREVSATVFSADSVHAEAALDSARRAAGVEDHHLPRVLDVGVEDGTAYVISEALHGAESIAAMVQFDPLPPEEVRRLVGEAASGLGAAAARGLHHLQLTPHDIVTSPDGAVSVLGLPTDAALAGAEELSSEDASRADTVALVQIAYAGLTGHWPGDDPVPGVPDVSRRADGELPAPSELASGVPGDLDALCRTTLGADEGPRTPGELARQLAPWSSERVTSSTRRTTGSGGQSGAATLRAVPGGGGSTTAPASPPRAPAADAEDATAEVPVKTALPRAAASTVAATIPEGDETAQISRADLMKARERTAAPPPADDDWDPSFTELESPVPGLGGHFEPDNHSSRLALALVVLLVIIAVVFAAIGLQGIGRSSSPDSTAAASGAAPAASSSASGTTSSSTTESAPVAEPLTISRVTSYGINGGENNALAKYVVDDDADTYWNTGQYGAADLGGRGGGTGLLIDLGSLKTLNDLRITTAGSDSTINVFVSDKIEPVSTRQPETTLKGRGTQTADLHGVQARYITLWVTSLSKQSDGAYQERISKVAVYS
ncbi:hypothetical protein [Flexivirga oryzae]|uniref:Protein kinase domain-containing protein n=1 Tax=Flexivirga oryzae TaxID=1794944 RepID=A0A839NA32_9MICO|nr:hypothetical protein [Flexivirga oryzae]MBB2893669.1 hypothetical protein [Flexivirga oryzae]